MFERCGVAISARGDCAIMVGPESQIFAADFGVIEHVFVLYEYRESADVYKRQHRRGQIFFAAVRQQCDNGFSRIFGILCKLYRCIYRCSGRNADK